MVKAVFNIKNTLSASKLFLNLKKNLVEWNMWNMWNIWNMWNMWNIAVNGAENLTLRKADQKYQVSFRTWCWRKIEKDGEGENCY